MAKNTTKQSNIRESLTTFKTRSFERAKPVYHRTTTFIKARPLASFLIALGLLFLIIIAGRVFQKTPETKTDANITKAVNVYGIGESPKATFQAKIEKSGVIKIIAQAPGVVQEVNVKEGDTVYKGQQLVSLSSNYQGGTAQSVQRQIAQAQYQNVLDTFGTQNALIENQRSVATASAQQAQDIRDITRKSVDETSTLINQQQSSLDQINQSIANMKAGGQDTIVDPTTQQPKTLDALQAQATQLQGAIDQLNAQQRTTDYQSSNDKPPAQLANLQKDIALKQLDIQQKSLALNKEVSQLQLNLAYVAEATMYPASPFAGTVERINVHPGQTVNPGTVIATIAADDIATTAILLVPQPIAQSLSTGEPSLLTINNKSIAVTPYHISTEATDGQLYSVMYDIPDDQQAKLSDGQYISIQVPISTAKTTSADPLIPIDSVYLSQSSAQVLVRNNNQAVAKTVTLGKVFGNFVEVLSGLQNGDEVITDRNVVAGDKITVNK